MNDNMKEAKGEPLIIWINIKRSPLLLLIEIHNSQGGGERIKIKIKNGNFM